MKANNAGTAIAKTFPSFLIVGVYFLWLNPTDWKEDWKPCNKCNANAVKERM